MEPRRFSAKGLVLTALLLAVGALYFIPMLATATTSTTKPKSTTGQNVYNTSLLKVTISMTNKGITVSPKTLKPGNHLLTISNSSTRARGVELIGVDIGDNPTVRYTKILKPGTSGSFRWFFATDRTTYVRDVLAWKSAKTGVTTVTFGTMKKAIHTK